MAVTEVDPDDPLGPPLNIRVGIKLPHETFDRKRKHARDTELRDAVNAGFALVRQIAFLELRAALRRNVPCVLSVNANVDAEFPRAMAHFAKLTKHPAFAPDVVPYLEKIEKIALHTGR